MKAPMRACSVTRVHTFPHWQVRHLDFDYLQNNGSMCDPRNTLKMYLDWWLLREADALVASGDRSERVRQ